MNVLHLVYDEKFVTFAAEVFASCSGTTNRYLVIVNDDSAPLRFVANLANKQRVTKRYFRSHAMMRELEWCDVLIVHYLGLPGAKLILRAPSRVLVVWSGWGGDYYDLLPHGEQTLLGDATRSLLLAIDRERSGRLRTMPRRIRSAVMRVRNRLVVDPLLRRAIRRVNYFSAPIPEDFDVFKRLAPGKKHAEYAQLNYASVERTFSSGPAVVTGDAILVGNSASATNNHADVFDRLAKLDLGGRRIIVPLSYGDEIYRDAVIAYGRRLFGERFEPLIEYMAIERYNVVIGQCSVALMGHRRQQGVGNIAMLLLIGARVFIDRASPVLGHLKARGAYVSALDELANGSSAFLEPLSPEQQRANRSVVEAAWGHDVVLRNTRQFIARLEARAASSRA